MHKPNINQTHILYGLGLIHCISTVKSRYSHDSTFGILLDVVDRCKEYATLIKVVKKDGA